jgi:hypothetical protein
MLCEKCLPRERKCLDEEVTLVTCTLICRLCTSEPVEWKAGMVRSPKFPF